MKNDKGRWVQPECTTGKRGYETRKIAREAGRATARHGGGHLTPYRCVECGWWHNGHIPPAVRNGELDRRELRPGHYQSNRKNRS